VTLNTPIKWVVSLSVMRKLALDIFHLHAKYGDSRFGRSGGMIPRVEIETDHALLMGDSYPNAEI